MTNKILVLCDAFTPPAYIPRVANLCKNLDKETWQPTICSEQYADHQWATDICPVHLMRYYPSLHSAKWLALWALNAIFHYKERKFEKFVENHTDINQMRLIFCSTFNLFPLMTAAKLSQKYNIPLVVDLRDIAEQWGNTSYTNSRAGKNLLGRAISRLIEQKNIKHRDSILKRASAVTTVSPWHKAFLSKINPNTHLIYNGFDADKFFFKKIQHPTFDICYTGRIYDFNLRQPDLLLQAVSELDSEGMISPSSFKINWYIDLESHAPMDKLFKKYNISQYNHLHPYISPDQVPDTLNRSSINLILANHQEDGPYGIMTTKLFESIGVEKPILCVRSDKDCIANTLSYTKSGLAADTADEVKQFISHWLNIWQTSGHTHVQVEHRSDFSRQNQALQFEDIFLKIIQH